MHTYGILRYPKEIFSKWMHQMPWKMTRLGMLLCSLLKGSLSTGAKVVFLRGRNDNQEGYIQRLSYGLTWIDRIRCQSEQRGDSTHQSTAEGPEPPHKGQSQEQEQHQEYNGQHRPVRLKKSRVAPGSVDEASTLHIMQVHTLLRVTPESVY